MRHRKPEKTRGGKKTRDLNPLSGGLRGIPFFKSDLLEGIGGLVHTFPCRTGRPGEPLAGMKARLKAAFGMDAVITVKQVHGVEVVACDGDPDRAENLHNEKADAAITRTPGLAVGVLTADCVPVLVADPVNRVVAAIHAGWRGLAAGIVGAAVEAMSKVYSSKPRDMVAAVGPHVMSCCYEVGPEVARVFDNKFGGDVLMPGKGDRSFLNLEKTVIMSLTEAGFLKENIDMIEMCTCCNDDLFYSYRRDGRGTGRQLSFIFFR